MPKTSPFPKHPVRVLRNLLGFSSAASFAAFVGLPAETIRNFEQGRRTVTDRAAKQIGIATGIFPEWLQSGSQAKGVPMTLFGPLTKERFEEFTGLATREQAEPNFSESISDLEFDVARVLRAAMRKGRLSQCHHGMVLAMHELVENLRIERIVKAEITPEIDGRFSYSLTDDLPPFGSDGELDWSDYERSRRLLSSSAVFRWEEELAEGGTGAQLLAEIDTLRAVVEASFALPRRDGDNARVTPPLERPSPTSPVRASKTSRRRKA